MTRIIAGLAGGRRLVTPPGVETRPTSDRVREALFSILDARDAVDGARVLDLFAGSGALGLEAASRGAAVVILVDSSRSAVAAARRNAATITGTGSGPGTGGALVPARVEVVLSPALKYLRRPDSAVFDLVLLDPPYPLAEEDLAEHLQTLAADGRLADGAVVVVERGGRSPQPAWPPGLEPQPARRYGETALWIAVRVATPQV
jgi:16S rRNA (guanine966-N2)-methyltransferase